MEGDIELKTSNQNREKIHLTRIHTGVVVYDESSKYRG